VMSRVEVAAVMAAVTAKQSTNNDLVIFGHSNRAVKLRRGASVLAGVTELVGKVGAVGHATFGHTAIADHFDHRKHDRVVLFTDDQMHDAGAVDLSGVPLIYTVDLAGYRPRSQPSGGQVATRWPGSATQPSASCKRSRLGATLAGRSDHRCNGWRPLRRPPPERVRPTARRSTPVNAMR
ncbi:MAG: hypothetical protein GY724_04790, partial [Actinomycetia bacterium]|nr:hypothetical protein [Actinomycetes bacterium]